MSVKRCANCWHPAYRHSPDDMELCRIKGCSCPGFLTEGRGSPAGYVSRADLIQALEIAHNHHAFGPEDCTPANCTPAGVLALLPDPEEGAT